MQTIQLSTFVPHGFVPQELVEQPAFILKKLCYSDAELDYKAVLSSVDLIRKIRGGDWPTSDLSYEDDLIDLGWHQREFEYSQSFSYTVLNKTRDQCIGCVYIYPIDKPWVNAPLGSDAVVNMWVTETAYQAGLYGKLFWFVKQWISENWPFQNPYYSNVEIPAKP